MHGQQYKQTNKQTKLRSPLWPHSFGKVEMGLHCSSLSAPNQVVYVWHPTLFITGAILKTQRKLCEFKRKNSPLRLKNFWILRLWHTQNTTVYLPQQNSHSTRQDKRL